MPFKNSQDMKPGFKNPVYDAILFNDQLVTVI